MVAGCPLGPDAEHTRATEHVVEIPRAEPAEDRRQRETRAAGLAERERYKEVGVETGSGAYV